MFEAVLFDLDGTLLNINMEYFLKHYFRNMAEMAVECGYHDTKKLIEQINKSTWAMITNRDPQKTNEEVFMADFFRNWDYPPAEFEEFFHVFYEKRFPRLRQYSRPFVGVPDMIEGLLSKGLKIVIATNAVFPFTALQQRLDWAEIGHFRYELITSYEIMHFCKPHVEYYQEIVDKIGVKPEYCLMVGNDVGEDLPAGEIGIKTFLVENNLISNRRVDYQPDWRGKLEDLFLFMKQLPVL